MFGLSIKEVLTKEIVKASIENVAIYSDEIRKKIDVLNGGEEEKIEEAYSLIRRDYLNAVADIVISRFRNSSPETAARIQLTLISPVLCGYEDIDINSGISAGYLYAICYYAIKNKIAEPRDCIALNHMQNDIMNEALHSLN